MSVVPVCWPLRLHAVSPCLIAKTFTIASFESDVVGLGRTDTHGWVQVNIDEVQTRRGSPMARQSRLDVILGEGLLEQRVVVEIDLTDRQVVGGPPVRTHQ